MKEDYYGFLSTKWRGMRTLRDFNGTRWKYSSLMVDVVDIPRRKKIGRMTIGDVLRKFR